MDLFADPLLLSRLQFALTAMFHILWPVLTIGLSLFLVLLETLWVRSGNAMYYRHARFWGKLLLLNFGVGVVTGIPLEFEFGTNWAPFAINAGDFFGNILGFEGAMAFMLEAGFIGIMFFGWKRVTPLIHLFATSMVAFGASLSAFWIMVANAWMLTPTGVRFVADRVVVDSYYDAIFNPAMLTSVTHMWLACLETSLFVIGGMSAWYLLQRRHVDFFTHSFRLSLIAAVIVTPLQILVGDASGLVMAQHQPAKLAATEAHWHTNPPGEGAPWALLAWPNAQTQRNDWAIEIPHALSLIVTHSLTGPVKGLADFPRQDQPPVLLPFYAFRIMLVIGFSLFGLALWSAWAWWRARHTPTILSEQRGLLRAWIWAAPLAYIAVEMGWVVREVGRQPWVVHGFIRTADAVSKLPANSVLTTLLIYLGIYTALLIAFLFFARRIFERGPNLDEPLPPWRAAAKPEHLP
ncbi:MAG: cytochrome ubiquinol oxidase subunit I [Gammaproteobacteria bacterium]|nr:cytochrome ubiquinol oxidase subunit I [Gammaproteobacteria bacterium]